MRPLVVFLLLVMVALAGCSSGDGGAPTTTTTTSSGATRTVTDSPTGGPATCTYTETAQQPGCLIAEGCAITVTMAAPYAAVGGNGSSEVFAFWTRDGIGIADLQDESDHQHIVATGQGRFNLTQPGAQEFVKRFEPRVGQRHAMLAWFAAVDEDLADAFCTLERPRGGNGTFRFTEWGNNVDADQYRVDPTSSKGRAFCAIWHAAWRDAGVEITGGHHGALCGQTDT